MRIRALQASLLIVMLTILPAQALLARTGAPDEDRVVAEEIVGPTLAGEMRAWDSAFSEVRRQHAEQLVFGGDADALLAAVLLYPWTIGEADGERNMLPMPPVVQGWFEQARRLEPDHVLLAWLEAVRCPIDADRCDRDAALARLARVDPDNAAVWVEWLRDEANAGDRARQAEFLRRASTSERYDVYDVALGRLLFTHTRDLKPPSISAELNALFDIGIDDPDGDVAARMVDMQLLGIWMLYVLPSMQPIVESCRGSNTIGETDRGERCRDVLSLMADNGNSILMRLVGFRFLLQRANDHPDAAALRERFRSFQWRHEQGRTLMPSALPPAGYAEIMLTQGELAAVEWLMTSAGLSLEPPCDWVPEHASDRALIGPDAAGCAVSGSRSSPEMP